MASFTLHASISAPIDTVFDVLTDHRGYAAMTLLRSSTLEREGSPAPNGIGAVRRLALAGPPIREEVTEFELPTRFGYKMLSGLPVRSHTGTVDLSTGGSGTSIVWRVDTTPSIPVPDRLWAQIVRPGIQMLLKGVTKESERRAGSRS